MKKIIIFIVGVITIIGIIVGYECFYTKTIKKSANTTKNMLKKSEKREKTKMESKENIKVDNETQPSVPENDDKNENITSNEPKKEIQNNTNNNTYTNSSTQDTSQSVIQNNTQENIVHEEPQQPQVDPNQTDTSHYLYSIHHGVIDYYDFSSCTNAGYDIQRNHKELNLSHSCYEVYNISGNVKGYFLDITENGNNANYLK